MPTRRNSTPGQVQGREAVWEIGPPLAAGGFGSVFEASSAHWPRAVAKFVENKPGADRELLLNEALLAAKCEHVVPILDTAEFADSLVLVMPRAERSLTSEVARGALAVDVALAILADLAEALGELQAAEIVHRDLKPDNVLLLDGRWQVCDLGIGRYRDAVTSSHTRKSALTPQYAAPEQWERERTSDKTDVYAFGVIAYQLLEGRLPFDGQDQEELHRQHLLVAPPPLSVGNPKLELLVVQCLSKEPEARPSPAQVQRRLAAAAESSSGGEPSRLAEVSARAAQREAEDVAQARRETDEADTRARVFAAAAEMFSRLPAAMVQYVEAEAPNAYKLLDYKPDANLGVLLHFGLAELRINPPQAVRGRHAPFDVVAEASVSVLQRSRGYRGRSHSLWYCDAERAGDFSWYELAFMESAFLPRSSEIEPFDCSPSNAPVNNVIGKRQLAWGPREIDLAEPDEFVRRWSDWFALAAEAKLPQPSQMPEPGVVRPYRQR